jgi:hypothetical protein
MFPAYQGLGRKILVLQGTPSATRYPAATPDARVNMYRHQYKRKSLGFHLQRSYLVVANYHHRPVSCKNRRLIMHMHANAALGTGYYCPRKLHPFQRRQRDREAWLPSTWSTLPTPVLQGPPLNRLQTGQCCSYQVAFSIVPKSQTSYSRLRNNITDTSPSGPSTVRSSFASPPRGLATVISGTVSRRVALHNGPNFRIRWSHPAWGVFLAVSWAMLQFDLPNVV